jgi:hypothetical protein
MYGDAVLLAGDTDEGLHGVGHHAIDVEADLAGVDGMRHVAGHGGAKASLKRDRVQAVEGGEQRRTSRLAADRTIFIAIFAMIV